MSVSCSITGKVNHKFSTAFNVYTFSCSIPPPGSTVREPMMVTDPVTKMPSVSITAFSNVTEEFVYQIPLEQLDVGVGG